MVPQMRGEQQNARRLVQLVLKTCNGRDGKRGLTSPMGISYKCTRGGDINLRFRCRADCCPFLKRQKTEQTDDIAMEDKEADAPAEDDEGEDSEGDQEAAAAASELLQVAHGEDQDEGDEQGGSGPSASEPVRDVFPYSESTSYYEGVLDLGNIAEQQTCYYLTTTAHPSGWMAQRKNCTDVHVYYPRATDHSIFHGQKLAAEAFLAQRLKKTERAKQRLLIDTEQSFIRGPVLDHLAQTISAFDVSTGPEWFDGLNSAVWDPTNLQKLDQDKLAKDLDLGGFLVTPSREDRPRGLLAQQAYREGDTIARLACLWFDQVPPVVFSPLLI